ncbi:MAG TPA: zf-HC2 domain-containing protein [Planctomycetota bacterium]|nr:zf-HC2 domain-containing protein [Planctomycetota bacterium]HRR79491.1 zf-HC2 domain-containing protein [Planctomycetota bacterium]HRT96749.1 zf-HC2 domain-containing protein [Planctomycetota bacterium]
MTCKDLLKMLNDYVDGDVDPSFCSAFEEHLRDCDPCKVVVDTIRNTIRLYKDEGVVEIPILFRERLHSTLRRKWQEKRGAGPPPGGPAR